jgi:hypothetical protein
MKEHGYRFQLNTSVFRFITLIVVGCALIGTTVVIGALEEFRHRQLSIASTELRTALTNYSDDHEGEYPIDPNTLIHERYLKHWPKNPYGPGQLKPLSPIDPPNSGTFLYRGLERELTIAGKPDSVTTLIDRCVLILYSPSKRTQYQIAALKREMARIPLSILQDDTPSKATVADLGNIDWEHVDRVIINPSDHHGNHELVYMLDAEQGHGRLVVSPNSRPGKP